MPIYDASGYPVVVLLQEYHLNAAVNLKLHEQVTFKRGVEKYDRIIIAPGKPEHWYRAVAPARQRAADIRHWMIFTLWKREAQLVNHYLAHPLTNDLPEMERAGSVAAAAAAVDAVIDGRSDNGVSQGTSATAAVQRRSEPTPVDDSYDAVVNRIKKRAATAEPSKNGSRRAGEG